VPQALTPDRQAQAPLTAQHQLVPRALLRSPPSRTLQSSPPASPFEISLTQRPTPTSLKPTGPSLSQSIKMPEETYTPEWVTFRIAPCKCWISSAVVDLLLAYEALQRVSHQSAMQHEGFVCEEFVDLILKCQWVLLSADLVLHEPNLCLSPLGVVP
jgi:hypothetical protein